MGFRRGHLLYFVTVADEGQITRAARKLHMAQPALSQAITQLEADLGIELLKRHARGVMLTADGEAFLVKARAAVSAWTEAVATAQSLARAKPSTVEFGFVGSPPGVDSPTLVDAFAQAHPEINLRYRELRFPFAPTTSWLAEVDLAVCHLPPQDPSVWTQLLRREPRAVLASDHHPLAEREELCVADVIDETFVGLDPSVEQRWAGFWSLNDHRGCSPRHITEDRASNPHEVLASLAVRDAITTVPASVARVILNVLTGVRAVPLSDADYASIMLVGREDRRTPLVALVRAFADIHLGGDH